VAVTAPFGTLAGALTDPPGGHANTWGTGLSTIHGPNSRAAEYNGLLAGLGMDRAYPSGNPAAPDPWGPMPRGEGRGTYPKKFPNALIAASHNEPGSSPISTTPTVHSASEAAKEPLMGSRTAYSRSGSRKNMYTMTRR